jgi:hypothetical protein
VEASLRSLLTALGLVCLRNPPMQRAANNPDLMRIMRTHTPRMTHTRTGTGGGGSGVSVLLGIDYAPMGIRDTHMKPMKPVSLLHRLAGLSSKFFKDKR